MIKKLGELIQKIKQTDKTRTINLAIFLTLLIALPVILNAPKKQHIVQQYAQTNPGPTSFPIYGVAANVLDNLANGWTAKISYGGASSIYDLYCKSPVYNGVNSISYTLTAQYDELDLISPQPFDISPYNYLTFYAQGGTTGQRFGIVLLGTDGKPIPNIPVAPMDQYGGLPVPGIWLAYNIPISAFNISNKTIGGIAFRDQNGGTQNIQPPPPIYFDEINFSTQMAQGPTDAPTISNSPAGTAAPYPTPEMPYYPQISPWVYIIPGIIVLLAIIFQ